METKNYLADFQSKLKAPKGQYNSFGKYKYRSAEDIVEAVKPIINPEGFSLTLTDEIVAIGNRYYVKAVACVTNGKEVYTSTAYAREEENKKGSDSSQITGAASSYARKYALNGLFAIDDTKDADATNDHGKSDSKPVLNTLSPNWTKAVQYCSVNGIEGILKKYNLSESDQKKLEEEALDLVSQITDNQRRFIESNLHRLPDSMRDEIEAEMHTYTNKEAEEVIAEINDSLVDNVTSGSNYQMKDINKRLDAVMADERK